MLLRSILLAGTAAAVALMAQQPAAVGFVEQSFLQKVASSGRAEVATAKMGVARASNPAVKTFAQRLLDDHTKINAEVDELARKKGVPLDLNAAAATDDLGTLVGDAFDRAFIDHMIVGHQKGIVDFDEQLKVSMDDDVKNFITTTLPILRTHLDQAKSLKR